MIPPSLPPISVSLSFSETRRNLASTAVTLSVKKVTLNIEWPRSCLTQGGLISTWTELQMDSR